MKPEKQRIAIAEAFGWKRKGRMKVWINPHPGGGWEHESRLPDYLNDLNAMHDAENMLDLAARRKFRNMLSRHTIPKSAAIHATAAQRAEAFLRTVGRWEE